MSEILRKWLTHSLGIILDLSPEKFGINARDGRLIAHLLHNYDIISSVQLRVIIPTDDPVEARDNLKHIKIWLNNINIHCEDAIFDDIADAKGSAAMRLFYQLFLKLESPAQLYMPQHRRFKQFMPMEHTRFKVSKVREELDSICGLENNPLAKPLIEHSELIEWYKTKYQDIEKKINDARSKYLQFIQDKCETKMDNIESTEPSGYYQRPDESRRAYDEFCGTIGKFDSNDDKNFTYDELLEMMRDARAAKYNPHVTHEMTEKLKQKFRQVAAARKYKMKLETVIVQDLWNNILKKQEEDFDKLIAEKTLKQSEYEKQIVTKCFDVRNQKTIIAENRRLVENLIAQRREEEFSNAVLNRIDDGYESKRKFDFERERIIHLHRKLYKKKLQMRAENNYNACQDVMNAFIDMAMQTGDYKKLHKENVPEHLSRNWRALFLANKSLGDYLQHVETVINETPGPVENIIQMEFDRQNILNDNDLFEYSNYLGQWQLSQLFPNPYHIDESVLNENYMLLGHIVHRLLLLKYPIPSNLQPPKLPHFSIAACVTGVTDFSLMNVLKDLLKHANVILIQAENAIHYVLKCFQTEMIGIEKIELKFFEETVNWIQSLNHPSTSFYVPDLKQSQLTVKAKHIGKMMKTPTFKKTAKVQHSESVDKSTQTPKKLPESLAKEEFTNEAVLGQYAYESLVLGKTLTDHAMAAIIVAYLQTLDDYNGYVLFNYPSTLKQAVILEHEITAKMPDVDLELKRDIESLEDVMPSLEFMLVERSELRVQKDSNNKKRLSKLVPNPIEEIAVYNDPKHSTFLTAFITARNEKKFDYENKKPTEMFDGDDPLETFYTNQGVHYILYYEKFDFETIVYLAKLIIGDFSLPLKRSADLFGSIYEELQEIYNKKQKKKGKPIEKSKKLAYHTTSISEIIDVSEASVAVESSANLAERKKKFTSYPVNPLLAVGVATVWENMELVYLNDIKELFFIKRANRNSIIPYCTFVREHMTRFITKPNNKQSLVQKFQYDYNSINNDLRDDGNIQAELHCRVDELRNKLWSICDDRLRESEDERKRIINDHWITDQMVLLTNLFINLIQIEMNRSADTLQVIQDYYQLILAGKLDVEDVLPKLVLKKVETLVRKLDYNASESTLPPKYVNDHPKDYTMQGMEINEAMVKILINAASSNFEDTPFVDFIEKAESVALKHIDAWNNKIFKLNISATEQAPAIKKSAEEEVVNLEYNDAINIELRRIRQRIRAIARRALLDLTEFFNCAKKTFGSIYADIGAQYDNEINSVKALCGVFARAIEDQVRIQQELVLDNKEFIVYHDTILYPFEAAEPKPPVTEHILDGEFTVAQLNQLFNIFYDIAPSGSIPERVITFVLQDIIYLDAEDGFRNNVPTLWKHIDPTKVTAILADMFGDPEFVDWRDFLIYNMGLRFPTEKEIIRAWMTYSLYDKRKREIIDRKHYNYVRLWFEYDSCLDEKTKSATSTSSPGDAQYDTDTADIPENDTVSSLVPVNAKELRTTLLKDLLFKMFQVKEDGMNYTGLLLAFCKDDNPILGVVKALSLSLRSLIGWDPVEGAKREEADILEYKTEQEIIKETEQQTEQTTSESNLSNYNCVCGDTTIIDFISSDETFSKSSSNDNIPFQEYDSSSRSLQYFNKFDTSQSKNETEGEQFFPKEKSFVSIALAHMYSDEQLGLYNERVYLLPFEATLVTFAATLPWHIRTACIANHSLRTLLEKVYDDLFEKHGHGSVYAFKFLKHPSIHNMLSTCFKFQTVYPPDIVRHYLKTEFRT